MFFAPLLIIFAAGCSSNKSAVDNQAHKMCLEAKDYMGCIKAFSPQSLNSNKFSKGNKCPEGAAYLGNGTCAVVACEYDPAWWGSDGPSDPLLVGKSTWNCPFSLWGGPGSMKAGTKVPVTYSAKCPKGEPALGWNSTCEAPYIVKTTKKKPLACRNGTWSPDHPQCKEAESAITSPMDMD